MLWLRFLAQGKPGAGVFLRRIPLLNQGRTAKIETLVSSPYLRTSGCAVVGNSLACARVCERVFWSRRHFSPQTR